MSDSFPLQTPRCIVRQVRPPDAAQILAAMECPEIARMHSGGFSGLPAVGSYIEVLQREYAGGKFKTLAVAQRGADLLLGCVTLEVHPWFARGELSYWIALPHRNKGYMTEAAAAMIDYGFSELGLKRIQAYHAVENPASGRVLEKAGMRYEGTMRLYNGCTDEKMYAVISTDTRA